jgi:hypothetical protein
MSSAIQNFERFCLLSFLSGLTFGLIGLGVHYRDVLTVTNNVSAPTAVGGLILGAVFAVLVNIISYILALLVTRKKSRLARIAIYIFTVLLGLNLLGLFIGHFEIWKQLQGACQFSFTAAGILCLSTRSAKDWLLYS